jgi:hypothetical protein
MTAALTTSQLAADFAVCAEDMPVSAVWETRTIAGTRGMREIGMQNDERGYLADYRYSVWLPLAGMTTAPKPGDRISIDSVTRQVLATGGNDGVVIRLDLGDIYA